MSCPVTLSIESHLRRESEQDAEVLEADPLEGLEMDPGVTLEEWETREEAHEITIMEIT